MLQKQRQVMFSPHIENSQYSSRDNKSIRVFTPSRDMKYVTTSLAIAQPKKKIDDIPVDGQLKENSGKRNFLQEIFNNTSSHAEHHLNRNIKRKHAFFSLANPYIYSDSRPHTET